MLAPCVCVRECAPERGGARRRCLPFLASFGLCKFWAAPAHQRRPEGAERSRSDLCASRRWLGPRVCTNCGSLAYYTFFFCLAAKTRDEKGSTRSILPIFATKAGPVTGSGISPRMLACLLWLPVSQGQGSYIQTVSR